MIELKQIYISQKLEKELKKKGLRDQFLKIKKSLLKGNIGGSIQFKLRSPKHEGVWYFRINKQYRLYGRIEENNLFLFKLDNHQ